MRCPAVETGIDGTVGGRDLTVLHACRSSPAKGIRDWRNSTDDPLNEKEYEAVFGKARLHSRSLDVLGVIS